LINNHLKRVLHFKGSPYEIGFAAGRKLKNRLGQKINHYITNQPIPKDIEKLHVGAIPWLRSLPNRYQEEFQGMAQGANIPLQLLAEFNFIEECDVNQCSAAIFPFENNVWVARNNDSYVPELWGYVTIREVEGRIPTINFSMEGDVFTPTGINKEKLWLHYNYLTAWDEPAKKKPHFPAYVFLTEALELCTCIEDVEMLLNEIDRDGGMLLFAVDGKTNEFALFECLCSKFYRREPSNDWIVGTNHCCVCEDKTLSAADYKPLGTISRYKRMEYLVQSLSTAHNSLNLPEDLIHILADDQIERRVRQIVTVYSNVACPSTEDIWYTFGGYPAASKGNWQRLEWPWKD
jgi:hypothetical protein